jgi:hypothetical protein
MYFGQTLETYDYMIVLHKVKNAKNQHPKILLYKYILIMRMFIILRPQVGFKTFYQQNFEPSQLLHTKFNKTYFSALKSHVTYSQETRY